MKAGLIIEVKIRNTSYSTFTPLIPSATLSSAPSMPSTTFSTMLRSSPASILMPLAACRMTLHSILMPEGIPLPRPSVPRSSLSRMAQNPSVPPVMWLPCNSVPGALRTSMPTFESSPAVILLSSMRVSGVPRMTRIP